MIGPRVLATTLSAGGTGTVMTYTVPVDPQSEHQDFAPDPPDLCHDPLGSPHVAVGRAGESDQCREQPGPGVLVRAPERFERFREFLEGGAVTGREGRGALH